MQMFCDDLVLSCLQRFKITNEPTASALEKDSIVQRPSPHTCCRSFGHAMDEVKRALGSGSGSNKRKHDAAAAAAASLSLDDEQEPRAKRARTNAMSTMGTSSLDAVIVLTWRETKIPTTLRTLLNIPGSVLTNMFVGYSSKPEPSECASAGAGAGSGSGLSLTAAAAASQSTRSDSWAVSEPMADGSYFVDCAPRNAHRILNFYRDLVFPPSMASSVRSTMSSRMVIGVNHLLRDVTSDLELRQDALYLGIAPLVAAIEDTYDRCKYCGMSRLDTTRESSSSLCPANHVLRHVRASGSIVEVRSLCAQSKNWIQWTGKIIESFKVDPFRSRTREPGFTVQPIFSSTITAEMLYNNRVMQRRQDPIFVPPKNLVRTLTCARCDKASGGGESKGNSEKQPCRSVHFWTSKTESKGNSAAEADEISDDDEGSEEQARLMPLAQVSSEASAGTFGAVCAVGAGAVAASGGLTAGGASARAIMEADRRRLLRIKRAAAAAPKTAVEEVPVLRRFMHDSDGSAIKEEDA